MLDIRFLVFYIKLAILTILKYTIQHIACMCARSCPTLCDPMDCSLPGSSVHGIFQQEYWSGLPFPTPGDVTSPGIKPASLVFPALAGRFFTNSVTWEVYIHNYIPTLYFQRFFIISNRYSVPIKNPHSPSHQPLVTCNLLSVSTNLCKWWHAIFILLCLAYFTYNISKVHPCCSMCQNFIPFCG